ncbi:MAG TPA: 2-phospho-L-lactate guanylyltransferase [Candidatus Limnocylindrales bacterium]|nr:2-phospho-L-lactate guanylyltransferase [Candidatus Limnocylindrales bacterium]
MTHRPRVVAIVPVGAIEGAKSRLGAVLDAEERRDLALRLAATTIRAAVATPGIDETLVVTPDDEVRDLARRAGARPLRQRAGGLNDGLRQAREEAVAAGARAILVLPIDIPQVSPDHLEKVVALASTEPQPLVAIVPDRHGRGTNALLVSPPGAIEFCFGGDSKDAHVGAAHAAGARVEILDGPLTLDIDTPEDLLIAQAETPEAVSG